MRDDEEDWEDTDSAVPVEVAESVKGKDFVEVKQPGEVEADVALALISGRVGLKYTVESLTEIDVSRDRPGRGGKGGVTSFKSSSTSDSAASSRALTVIAFFLSDVDV